MLTLVRRHGRNTTSFQVTGRGYRYFFWREDACVAFVDTGSAWVAAGEPIAPDTAVVAAAAAFAAEAKRHQRRAVFFATEGGFVRQITCYTSILIGEQPVWSPLEWRSGVAASSNLRQQLQRARSKGVLVESLDGDALSPQSVGRCELDALVLEWMAAHPMPPMGFVVAIDLDTLAHEKRHYVARWRGRTVGYVGLTPVSARSGWFIEHVLRDPSAPNGTVELLVDQAMADLVASGTSYVTLGLAPLSGAVDRRLRVARMLGTPLYNFAGVRSFKEKLRPQRWDPVYLSFPNEVSSSVAILDSLRAFSNGSLVRFGMDTLLRQGGRAKAVAETSIARRRWGSRFAKP